MSNGLNVDRQNDAYLKHFVKQLRETPGEVLATAAIAGFRAAVSHTYMDSGQFAFNWQIGVGKTPVFVEEIPYRGKLIKRGDKLTDSGATQKIYTAAMKANRLPVGRHAQIKGTALFKEIVRRGVWHVSITNPYWDSKYGSESYSAGSRNGYPANAAVRPGHMVDRAIQQASTRAAHRVVKRLEAQR